MKGDDTIMSPRYDLTPKKVTTNSAKVATRVTQGGDTGDQRWRHSYGALTPALTPALTLPFRSANQRLAPVSKKFKKSARESTT